MHTILNSTSKGKQHEVAWNKGCLGEFETAFDGEVEAIADILDIPCVIRLREM
jgi:hypothetical protein